MKVLVLTLVTAAAVAFPLGVGASVRPTLAVSPQSVARGHAVVIHGSAGGCPAGDAVTILSHAFVHTHDFAGVPAVFAAVRSGGTFTARTRIPASKSPGRYTVTARCGGGNFGVLRMLTVRG
jgi:hypothetical protein